MEARPQRSQRDVLGAVLLLEFLARLWAAADKLDFITRPIALLDVAVLVSLLAPALTENFALRPVTAHPDRGGLSVFPGDGWTR
jgi:hypothetical protein